MNEVERERVARIILGPKSCWNDSAIISQRLQDWTYYPEVARALTKADAILALTAGLVLVPREPTGAMLQAACDKHAPGESMGLRHGYDPGECPRFIARRRIWKSMVEAFLSNEAPPEQKAGSEGEAEAPGGTPNKEDR